MEERIYGKLQPKLNMCFNAYSLKYMGLKELEWNWIGLIVREIVIKEEKGTEVSAPLPASEIPGTPS